MDFDHSPKQSCVLHRPPHPLLTLLPLSLFVPCFPGFADLVGFPQMGAPSHHSAVSQRHVYQEGYIAQMAVVPGKWPKLPLLHNGMPPVPIEYAIPATIINEIFGRFVDEVGPEAKGDQQKNSSFQVLFNSMCTPPPPLIPA